MSNAKYATFINYCIFRFFFCRSFEQPPDFSLDGTQLKAIVLHALQSLHGQVRLWKTPIILICFAIAFLHVI